MLTLLIGLAVLGNAVWSIFNWRIGLNNARNLQRGQSRVDLAKVEAENFLQEAWEAKRRWESENRDFAVCDFCNKIVARYEVEPSGVFCCVACNEARALKRELNGQLTDSKPAAN